MTAEQHFFIQILTDHVHGRPSVPETDSLNWEKVYYYAQEQALPGLVYVQTKDFFKNHKDIAPDIEAKLHQGFYSDVYLYANRRAEFQAFARQCREVPMILMKGIALQEYYPVPALRSMGDIDVVIHTEDREKTDRVMLENGYSKMVNNHAVWTYDKDYIEFEIHDHMFYEYLANEIDYRSYFDQIWDHISPVEGEENIYIPDEEFHFLFLITHLAKHITNKGIGFRGFLDLTFMIKGRAGRWIGSGSSQNWKS